MKRPMLDIKEMMEMFEQDVHAVPAFPDADTRLLRMKLLKEEFYEYVHAEHTSDMVELADALADVCVIALGTAHAYGIPLDAVWQEVHRSNMGKRNPDTGEIEKRPDGKVIKPDGWTPPDIKGVLIKHGAKL